MRYEAIEEIMKSIDEELVICNIGFASRELYEINDRSKNFYMLGSNGLASSIGLGLALAKPYEKVVVIDEAGSLLMNMGSLVTVFENNPSMAWIVIDNGSCSEIPDLVDIAKSVGFKNSYNFEEIDLKEVMYSDDASFIVYRTEAGDSSAPLIDLDPITIKERFMKSI